MRNDQDLEIQGYITYAGTSSMEIQLDLFQNGNLKASSIFLMVARDTVEKPKSYKVPLLKFDGEDDETKCQIREHLDIHKFFADKNNFMKEVSDQVSTQISTTIFEKNLLMHKQDRNLHGNIFGGHIMREAMEIGWLAGLIHSKGDYPLTYNIDDFQFLKPVPVGSIINFEAKIGYVVKNIMQLVVNCNIVDINKCQTKSNDLHLTLVAPKSLQLQKVIPHTYDEAMIYLDCKRRLDTLLS